MIISYTTAGWIKNCFLPLHSSSCKAYPHCIYFFFFSLNPALISFSRSSVQSRHKNKATCKNKNKMNLGEIPSLDAEVYFQCARGPKVCQKVYDVAVTSQRWPLVFVSEKCCQNRWRDRAVKQQRVIVRHDDEFRHQGKTKTRLVSRNGFLFP